MKNNIFKIWWNSLIYAPNDPKFKAGGKIKIAAIGGGTGLSTLLRGLKEYSSDISAVVTVTDDGSSSGEIRKDFDILPPGDIRKCISALAYDEDLISNLMEYRFGERGSRFSGHTLGNIWITALAKYLGSFEKAVQATTEIFNTAGKILPATLNDVNIAALYDDGKKVVGESKIAKAGKHIVEIQLDRKNVRANPQVVKALLDADLIILGPGSLYTSLVPNLLIPGIRNAICQNKKAVKIYIVNCSTEKGETEHYSVADHVDVIQKYSKKSFEYCVVNSRIMKKSSNQTELGEINNITLKKGEDTQMNVVTADVINEKNALFHDSSKLAKNVIKIYNKVRQR